MKDPRGIDIRRPRLSWLCADGVRQTAYELRARCGGGEYRSGGRVESGEMYSFFDAPLHSRDVINWQVRLWDENGAAGPWSEEAFFEMGLLEQSDYAAKWIDPELVRDPEAHKPVSYLRKRFARNKPLQAYIISAASDKIAQQAGSAAIVSTIITWSCCR